MKCPHCGKGESRVVDSRVVRDSRAVRRRRECLGCGRRFTTYEWVERVPLTVVKRDGRREPYDREKLIRGVATACRKRPVAREDVERLVDELEAELADEYRTEVSSSELGERVLSRLLKLDPVSYVRFASVYRQFSDVEEFSNELKWLRKEGG